MSDIIQRIGDRVVGSSYSPRSASPIQVLMGKVLISLLLGVVLIPISSSWDLIVVCWLNE